MWRAGVPQPLQIKLLRTAREKYDLTPLVIHAGYLINLASLDPVIRGKSIAAFQGELERAEAIGAEYLVVHPGNAKDNGAEQGIAAFVLGLQAAVEAARPQRVTVLFENTVGAGAQLGGKLEELRSIRDLAAELAEVKTGYCLDTCHLLGAGFDVRSKAAVAKTVRYIEATLGMEHVRVIHANDSKAPLGAHVDRHENIGRGHIGEDGFRALLTHPKLREKPFVLETPSEDDEEEHRRDIAILKSLAERKRS